MTIDDVIERLEKTPDGHWLAPRADYSVRLGGDRQSPRVMARVVLYDHFKGPRKQKYLRITCGEPRCCNPEHLEEVVPIPTNEARRKWRQKKRGDKPAKNDRPRKEKHANIETKAPTIFPGSPEFIMLQEMAIKCGFQPVRGILGIKLRKVA